MNRHFDAVAIPGVGNRTAVSGDDREMSIFAHVSYSPPDRNIVDIHADASIEFVGLSETRPKDKSGIAGGCARVSLFYFSTLMSGKDVGFGTSACISACELIWIGGLSFFGVVAIAAAIKQLGGPIMISRDLSAAHAASMPVEIDELGRGALSEDWTHQDVGTSDLKHRVTIGLFICVAVGVALVALAHH